MLINGSTSQWNSYTYIVVWRRTRSKCFNHSAFRTKGNDVGRSKTLRQKKRDSILAFSDECSSLSSTINSDISAGILIRLFVFIFSFFRIGKGLGVSMKGKLPSEFDDRSAHEEGRFLLSRSLLCGALLRRLYVLNIASLFSPLLSIHCYCQLS